MTPNYNEPHAAYLECHSTRLAQYPQRTFPLQTRLSSLLREARWILFAALAAWLTLVLATWNAADPGWSHSVPAGAVHNRGGMLGAYLADILLYLFGFSAWWWVVLLLHRVRAGYRRLASQLKVTNSKQPEVLPRVHWEEGIGFFLLMVGSLGMEALRLPSRGMHLPGASEHASGAGGVIGHTLADLIGRSIGFTGSTLAFLVMLAIGLSLFFSFSWLNIAERVGAWIEGMVFRVRSSMPRARTARSAKWPRPCAPSRWWPSRKSWSTSSLCASSPPSPWCLSPSAWKGKAAVAVLRPAAGRRGRPARHQPARPAAAQPGNRVGRDHRIHLAPDRKEAGRLRRVRHRGGGAGGPCHHALRNRAGHWRQGSQIVNLAKDLARALSLVSIRVVETIPGKNLMGLELPNPRRQMVKLSEILGSQTYHASHSVVTMALGKDIAGNPVVADLAKMPHLLVAGTTGSGKSVGINAMILSLLYKADASHTRLILIDPKMLEMSVYEGIPHLLAPVVTDMRQAGNALNWCVGEMEKRYRLMSKMGVRNLAGYNTKIRDAIKREEPIPNPFSLTPDQPEPLAPLPTIVVVIDELADLMMVVGKKIEELIARLAQKARAAGIHLILATQRPSVDVITGLIKANIPTRIAFQVSSKIDSRTILDQMGAETLLGQGDMLYMPPGTGLPVRVHGAFVSDDEVHRVVESLKAQGEPNYIEGLLEGGLDGDGAEGAGSVTGIGGDAESDPMYDQACEVVLKHRRASISLVQRHLRIGYNRAARLLEQMEQSGMVSAMQSNGNRDILVPAAAREEV